ncbi:MAG: hypothetical protein NTV81_01590 [Candidatus Komeilibacteria bacterium]|nr:hypothetical protein [Candidatus Komeilibacteria bacterium]
MATPVSNDIISNQATEVSDSEVHVMPEKFLAPKLAPKNSFNRWLLIGLIGVAVIGVGVAVIFLLRSQKQPALEPAQPSAETQPVISPAPQAPAETLVQKSPADRDRQRLETISQLQLALPTLARNSLICIPPLKAPFKLALP